MNLFNLKFLKFLNLNFRLTTKNYRDIPKKLIKIAERQPLQLFSNVHDLTMTLECA